jgi:hypothetical protein
VEAIFVFLLLMALLFFRIPVYLSLYLGGLIGFLLFTDLDVTFVAQTFLLKLQNLLKIIHGKLLIYPQLQKTKNLLNMEKI